MVKVIHVSGAQAERSKSRFASLGDMQEGGARRAACVERAVLVHPGLHAEFRQESLHLRLIGRSEPDMCDVFNFDFAQIEAPWVTPH